MKKALLVIFSIGLFSTIGFSQSGKNQIGVAAEIGIPTGDFGDLCKLGVGGTLKGLYGIGTAGQLTLTTGYISFGAKDEYKDLIGADKLTTSFIPILAGYRHNFDGFYAEPQVGYSIMNVKAKVGGVSGSESDGAFTWAVGFGYVISDFEVGAHYQSATKDGNSLSFVGFRIGYNFTLGGK